MDPQRLKVKAADSELIASTLTSVDIGMWWTVGGAYSNVKGSFATGVFVTGTNKPPGEERLVVRFCSISRMGPAEPRRTYIYPSLLIYRERNTQRYEVSV